MSHGIQPLKVEKFLKAALEYMEPLKGTYIYNPVVRDFYEKTDQLNAGYGSWLERLLMFTTQRYNIKGKHILDLGCGTGELTVRMNLLGYQAYGLDIHEKHLELAKILAEKNGLSRDILILNRANKLPFSNGDFDIITMFSVLEHIDDNTLSWLLPELQRVCRGLVYILVPNRLKPTDDHTGLRFVPWMPRWLALLYMKMRGKKHRYYISRDGSWDVHYRSLSRIISIFSRQGFILNFPPDEVIFPPLEKTPPITNIGKHLRLGTMKFFVGIKLPAKTMIKLGYPKQAFYPYLNLIFVPRKRG